MSKALASAATTTPPKIVENCLFAADDSVRLGGFALSLLLIANLLRAHFASPARGTSGRRAVRKFSASMTAYFVINALCLSASMLGSVCVACKRVQALPDTIKYDMLLYWAETFSINFLATGGIPVFFLTLDRCLAIAYPILYLHSTLQNRLNQFGIVVFAAAYAGCAVVLALETPISDEYLNNCKSFACLNPKFRTLPHNFLAFVFDLLNIFSCIYFLYLERAFSSVTNTANRVVKVTVIAEFVFVTMPTIFNVTCKAVFGVLPAKYMGSYVLALFSLNIAFCSVLYTVILFRRPTHFLRRAQVDATQIKSFSAATTPTN